MHGCQAHLAYKQARLNETSAAQIAVTTYCANEPWAHSRLPDINPILERLLRIASVQKDVFKSLINQHQTYGRGEGLLLAWILEKGRPANELPCRYPDTH